MKNIKNKILTNNQTLEISNAHVYRIFKSCLELACSNRANANLFVSSSYRIFYNDIESIVICELVYSLNIIGVEFLILQNLYVNYLTR